MRRFAAVLIVALAGCSGGTLGPSLSEAFCNDLQSGMSLFQIYGGVKDRYTPETFADRAYGFAAISCPAELTTNVGLRSFLEAWDIDPDL